MIQLVVEGVFLDLYENDPPKITLNIEDITDTKAVSTYTQNFRVPATTNNYQFFKSAFEINGLDFDVTIKRSAQILIDGAEFVAGELRLNKIYEDKISNKIDYEVLFLGETKDFASSVGNNFLCDIDTTELLHEFTIENITGSWDAYPEGDLTDGLLDGNILYPLVNFGNTYDDDGVAEQSLIEYGIGTNYFTNSSYPINPNRFKPMVRTKWVWDKIFSGSGFTYESEFINSDLFKQQYISAWGNDTDFNIATTSTENLAKISAVDEEGLGYISIGTPAIDVSSIGDSWDIPFNNIVFDYGNNIIDLVGSFYPTEYTHVYNYEVPETGFYDVKVQGKFSISIHNLILGDSIEVSISLKKYDPVTPATTDISTPAVGTLSLANNIITIDFDINQTGISLQAGEWVYFGITITGVNIISPNVVLYMHSYDGAFLEVTQAPGDFDIGGLLDCEYKQIDFIKDILTKFRLVMVPDRQNPKNFFIEPWSEYIGTGDVLDWTRKMDLSKDLQIEPLFFSQKQRITFTDKEDKDWLNDLNENQFKEVFGTLEVDSQNELLKDEREVKTNFSPTPITQINNATSTTNEDFIIPHIYAKETKDYDGTVKVVNNPIKPNTRLLFYNGLKAIDGSWYSQNLSGTVGFSNYPMVSPYQEYPLQIGTLDLNWQTENGYIQYGFENIGNSVYDNYWRTYINNIYSSQARRLTAYFILSAEDLFDFNFDDVIFVKDTYFYVEKIENIELGKKQPVKVSLIKLPNYRPDIDNYIPPGLYWEDIADDWDDITDLWETI